MGVVLLVSRVSSLDQSLRGQSMRRDAQLLSKCHAVLRIKGKLRSWLTPVIMTKEHSSADDKGPPQQTFRTAPELVGIHCVTRMWISEAECM